MSAAQTALTLVVTFALGGSFLWLFVAARQRHHLRHYIREHSGVQAHLAPFEQEVRQARENTARVQAYLEHERARFLSDVTDGDRRLALHERARVITRHYDEGEEDDGG